VAGFGHVGQAILPADVLFSASKPPLQKLRLADLRIPWLVFVFLWIDWVGERMKQFFWLGLNTLLPLVLAALCYLALCRDGVSWLRRSESV
jgi:hypothetical protein